MTRATQLFTYPILIVTVCAIGLLCCDFWYEYDVADIVVSLIGMYVLSIFLSHIYHYVRDGVRVRDQLFRAEQYQVTNELAKSMAHAIRNPLTATRGFLRLIYWKKQITEQVHTYCQHAESGIKEADEVITDYLRCAELEIKTPHTLYVQEEIDKKIIPQITPLCTQSKIEIIVCHLTNEPMYIEGQSDRFEQTMVNIMTNAVEAMPTGGKLEVTTWLDCNGVHVHVKDTGSGMSKQEIKRIGTPFYDRKTKGTGLGLMVTLRLIKAMKGTISYYSRPNKGTACLLRYKHAGEFTVSKGEKAMGFGHRFKEYEDVSLQDANELQRANNRKFVIFVVSLAVVVFALLIIKISHLEANRSVAEKMAQKMQDKNVKIAVIYKGELDSFSHEYFMGALKEGEAMGIQVDTFVANYDLTNLRYLLVQAAEKNYDGVIIDGGDSEIVEEIEKLVSKGIPVVAFDSASELSRIKGITMTTQDNIRMMDYALSNMFTRLHGKGNVAYLYAKTYPSFVTRHKVYEQFLIKNAGINEVKRIEIGQKEVFVKSKHVVAEMLKKHGKGKIDAIFSTHGEMARGAAQAIEEAGRNEIKIYAVEFTNADLYIIQTESSPYVSATGIDLREIGAVNVRLLFKKIAGEKTPVKYEFKPSLITQDELRKAEGTINTNSLKKVARGWEENNDFEEDWMKKLKEFRNRT